MDNRNLFTAVALTLLILFGYQYFFMDDIQPIPEEELIRMGEIEAPTDPGEAMTPDGATAPGLTPSQNPSFSTPPEVSREEALASDLRTPIETDKLTGSIRLAGGRLDDLRLKEFRETVDPESEIITLLSPSGAANPYFAEFGWVTGPEQGNMPTPGARTPWQVDGTSLAPGKPVSLRWDNGRGLVFTRVISLDEHYLFTVTQRVENTSSDPVVLSPYGLVNRTGTPKTSGLFILHEGPLGVLDGSLEELDYDDLADDGPVAVTSADGWLGITDKYWLTALVPPQDVDSQFKGEFRHARVDGQDRYQASYLMGARTVQPGQMVEVTSRLFAGAKEVDLIDGYQEDLGIARFDRAIDWGWFYFFTKPIFHALHWLFGLIGNYGIAIIILTLLIKIAFVPLSYRSYVGMAKLRELTPKMTELREKHKDDPKKQQQEMMELYRKEKVNPLAGCLPILIQIPVFFALYKVLYVTLDMRHEPFYLWVTDLSAPDPLLLTNLFGVIPWDPPSFLAIGIWPVLMGVSMYFQQKLNPQPPDPMQQRIFAMLPIIFVFILATFPVGLVIYWTFNNLFTIAQQWAIMTRQGDRPHQKRKRDAEESKKAKTKPQTEEEAG